ncbi:hypothetical protein M407DRAFT_32329 [Tulasnella calospora MUT 4182]|uniref:Uncharacterized protein n=1 Tax=Tulasnella calospora MUT 4182 TaxID=1051891 RepID=A0A0C3L964_9AGAM|nr:hypothetical protein M407DRAFT_32329 [Tulasnella calospora MUT 4182]
MSLARIARERTFAIRFVLDYGLLTDRVSPYWAFAQLRYVRKVGRKAPLFESFRILPMLSFAQKGTFLVNDCESGDSIFLHLVFVVVTKCLFKFVSNGGLIR